jgi:hypothetical protein
MPALPHSPMNERRFVKEGGYCQNPWRLASATSTDSAEK